MATLAIYPSVSKTLRTMILANAELSAILTGGVHTRPIVRDQHKEPLDPMRGSTPQAFEDTPPYRIKPCISIEEGDANKNSAGPVGATWMFPMLWCRSQPKDTEKAKLEEVFLQLHTMFGSGQIRLPIGTGGKIQLVGRTGPFDDKTISGSVVMLVRLQIDGIWRVMT